MEIKKVKEQLKKAMTVLTEVPDESCLESLLRQIPSENMPEILSLIKYCTEFADRERCRYFTMIRGAKHYHNCLVVARVLERVMA